MRTAEERITRMHERARQFKKKRDQMMLSALGSVSAMLGIALMLVTAYYSGWSQLGSDRQLKGSLLLGQSVGGYVLVAVLAFFVGVVVAVMIRRYRNRNTDQSSPGSGKEII